MSRISTITLPPAIGGEKYFDIMECDGVYFRVEFLGIKNAAGVAVWQVVHIEPFTLELASSTDNVAFSVEAMVAHE